MPLAGQSFESNVGNSYENQKSQREFEAFLAEEEQKKQGNLKKLVDQASAPLRQVAKGYATMQAPLWSRPVHELERGWQSGNPSILIGMFWDVLLYGFEDRPPVTQDPDVCEQIFKEFVNSTLPAQGWTLSPLGEQRIALFTYIQVKVGRNSVSRENLQLYFDALRSNDCFGAGELAFDESTITATSQPESAPTDDDFESLNLTGLDERRGKEVVKFLAETAAAPTAKAWLDSLATNFGFVPTSEDLDYSVKWFHDNNRSWFDRRSYDAFRLHMVHTGRWSTALFSESDIRARAIDRFDMNDRDVRGIVFHGSKEALLDLMQRRGVSLI